MITGKNIQKFNNTAVYYKPKRNNYLGAVVRSLRGISFPIGKDALVRHAERFNASNDVLYILDHFRDKYYGSMIDISNEAAKIE